MRVNAFDMWCQRPRISHSFQWPTQQCRSLAPNKMYTGYIDHTFKTVSLFGYIAQANPFSTFSCLTCLIIRRPHSTTQSVHESLNVTFNRWTAASTQRGDAHKTVNVGGTSWRQLRSSGHAADDGGGGCWLQVGSSRFAWLRSTVTWRC